LIVGAGLMGAQIGCEYALGGHEVTLVARDPRRLEERIAAAFELIDGYGLAPAAAVEAARGRARMAPSLDHEALGCDLAVESVPEELELKARLLRMIAEAAPQAILASNTSSIPIGTLGEAAGAPERVIGTHYLNPPLLMPPVEVVAGRATAPEVVGRVREILVALGKLPVLVRRDVPGFVWNRLQFALVRECAWLVENGVVSAEDIDVVVREGLARRWRRVGPLRSIALGGIDTWNRAGRNIVPQLSAASVLPDLTTVALTDGDLAADAAFRDAALAAELRAPTAT
jgi:3-hydroxybutyryl-CoA dehydrogenase